MLLWKTIMGTVRPGVLQYIFVPKRTLTHDVVAAVRSCYGDGSSFDQYINIWGRCIPATAWYWRTESCSGDGGRTVYVLPWNWSLCAGEREYAKRRPSGVRRPARNRLTANGSLCLERTFSGRTGVLYFVRAAPHTRPTERGTDFAQHSRSQREQSTGSQQYRRRTIFYCSASTVPPSHVHAGRLL